MTIEQWWLDFSNPLHLLTEGIYNIGFEILATIVFVTLSLKPIVTKIVRKELERDRNDRRTD
jgi:hypothetical protein